MNQAIMEKHRKKDPSRPSLSAFSIVILLFLTLYTLSLFGLLIWAIVTSFKPYGPEEGFFHNLVDTFKNFKVPVPGRSEYASFSEMLLNSFLYAFGCAVTNTLVPLIMAYACSRYPYKFSNIIYSLVIIAMIIPSVGTLPSEVSMAIKLGIYDTIWGQWIMKANFLGLYFLVFYDFFSSLPNPLFEAAKIDGANNGQLLFKIGLPLSRNITFTVFLLNFVTYWNDYSTPTIYLKHHPTLAVGLYSTFNYGIAYYKLNGAAAIVPIAFAIASPCILIYAIFHKKLLGNLNVGGIK